VWIGCTSEVIGLARSYDRAVLSFSHTRTVDDTRDVGARAAKNLTPPTSDSRQMHASLVTPECHPLRNPNSQESKSTFAFPFSPGRPFGRHRSGAIMPVRPTFALAPLLLYALLPLAPAPAIDFALPLPPSCENYTDVVSNLRNARIYVGPYDRHQHHRVHDSSGGSKLVLPVEQRSVPVAAGYSAHFLAARARLHDPAFFPLDARLRARVLAPDVLAALSWSLDQGSHLPAARQQRMVFVPVPPQSGLPHGPSLRVALPDAGEAADGDAGDGAPAESVASSPSSGSASVVGAMAIDSRALLYSIVRVGTWSTTGTM
jgi:hypothetical protein